MKKFLFILIGIGLSALLWGQAVTDPSFVDGRRTFIGAPLGEVAQGPGTTATTSGTAPAQGAVAEHLNAQPQAEAQGINLKDNSSQGIQRRIQFLEYLHGLTDAATPDGGVDGFIPAKYSEADDEVIIIGYDGKQPLTGRIEIPERLDRDGISGIVVGIGPGALSNLNISGTVVFPESVTFIKEEAFANNKIIGVEFTDKITEIGNSAFTNNQLTTVTIPNNGSLTTITYGTFSNNVLTSVNIPTNVTLIEHHAFSNNRLTALNIPTSVTQIDNSAFENNRLGTLTLPDSIKTIGDNAFATNRLTNIRISRNDSLTKLNYGVFSHNLLPTVEIPANVTEIGDNAFTDNLLKQVTIPKQVVEIGKGSFSVNALERVFFAGDETIQKATAAGQTEGTSLQSIGDGAFSYNRLTQVSIPNSVTFIGSQAFLANHISRLVLGSKLERIGSYAFQQNNLTGVTIPDEVREIGDGAFIGGGTQSTNKRYNIQAQPLFQSQQGTPPQGPTQIFQNKLTQVTLGDDITKPDTGLEIIGAVAFAFNQIESIAIPNSVQEIREAAFADNLIVGLSLGTSVQIIGGETFLNNRIETVRIPETCAALGIGAFVKNKINKPVIIPKGVTGNAANMPNVLNTEQRRAAIGRSFDPQGGQFILIFL